MKPIAKKSGNAIATAVATLIFTAAVPVGAVHADAKGKCIGANACRGKSDCSTGASACGGATPKFLQGQGMAGVDQGRVRQDPRHQVRGQVIKSPASPNQEGAPTEADAPLGQTSEADL